MEQPQNRYTILCGMQTCVVVATTEAAALRAAEGMSGCWPCKVVKKQVYQPKETTDPAD